MALIKDYKFVPLYLPRKEKVAIDAFNRNPYPGGKLRR